MKVRAVVLAGGAGTRFWPASRAGRPKQLLPLTGAAPMLVETITRVLPLTDGWTGVFVAGGRATEAATRALLPDLPSANLLIEPLARNTAPCIAWAADVIARVDGGDSVTVVLPSDHHIADVAAFRKALTLAIESASDGVITTLGVEPTRAETGYGYIEVGPERRAGVRAGVRFVEKPDRTTAEAYLAGGRHLWNAGMFIFRARDMLAAVERHQPAIAEALGRMRGAVLAGASDNEAARPHFPSMPSISVDFGVMEHLAELAVVPASFGWSDVGSWQSAWELADKDPEDNSASPLVVAVEARGNHVHSAGARRDKVVALLGVQDLIVVDTDDALLVAPRDRAQDVRLVVERLKGTRDDLL